jgi:hypothetical protein
VECPDFQVLMMCVVAFQIGALTIAVAMHSVHNYTMELSCSVMCRYTAEVWPSLTNRCGVSKCKDACDCNYVHSEGQSADCYCLHVSAKQTGTTIVRGAKHKASIQRIYKTA